MSTGVVITIVLFAIAFVGVVLGVPIAFGGRRTTEHPQAQDIATTKNLRQREGGSAPVVAAQQSHELADLRPTQSDSSRKRKAQAV
jgi:hypothetical protein